MKRTASILAAAATIAAVSATPAVAVPTHLHCMTNASGNTHSIARGITLQAPHDTLHNFHENVHTGAFAGTNPQIITADLTEPYSC
jgi:hypothetical protein